MDGHQSVCTRHALPMDDRRCHAAGGSGAGGAPQRESQPWNQARPVAGLAPLPAATPVGAPAPFSLVPSSPDHPSPAAPTRSAPLGWRVWRAVRATHALDGLPRIPRPREGGVTGAGPGVPSRVRRDPLRRWVAAHPRAGLRRATHAQRGWEALAPRATQTRQRRARHRSRVRPAGARRRQQIQPMQRCASLLSSAPGQLSVGAAVSGLVGRNRVSGCARLAN